MSTPTDDEFRTIGLPSSGAARDLMKGYDPKKAGDRSPVSPRKPEIDNPPSRRGPMNPIGAEPPVPSTPLDAGREIEATVPPAGRRRDDREARPPVGSKPSEDQRPRPTAGPSDARPREEPLRAQPRPVPPTPVSRREPPRPAPIERSLDEPDYRTAQMPGARPPLGGRPLPEVPTSRDQDLGVPLGDDTYFSPLPAAVPPAAQPVSTPQPVSPPQPPPVSARNADPRDRHLPETSQVFPGSDPGRRPPITPARPAIPAGLRDRPEPQDAYERTMGWVAPSSQASGTRSILQFFHNSIGRWSDLGEARREGNIVGRYTFQQWDANPEGLAEEHLAIGYEGDELYVEPLPTLNGVYQKLAPHRRAELTPQTRFRIGRHVLAFRLADPLAEITPLRSDDGEVFQSRVLAPLGFVDLIGPDGRPYLNFPVTKRDERGTRIGRAGVECDIALTGDEWVSLRHARIGFSDGKCWLEDLESRNGTFLNITSRTPLRRGSPRFPDTGDEILVGGYKIRVIAEDT